MYINLSTYQADEHDDKEGLVDLRVGPQVPHVVTLPLLVLPVTTKWNKDKNQADFLCLSKFTWHNWSKDISPQIELSHVHNAKHKVCDIPEMLQVLADVDHVLLRVVVGSEHPQQ